MFAGQQALCGGRPVQLRGECHACLALQRPDWTWYGTWAWDIEPAHVQMSPGGITSVMVAAFKALHLLLRVSGKQQVILRAHRKPRKCATHLQEHRPEPIAGYRRV